MNDQGPDAGTATKTDVTASEEPQAPRRSGVSAKELMNSATQRLKATLGIDRSAPITDAERVLRAFIGFTVVGFSCLLLLCIPAAGFGPVSVGALLAGASTVVGGLFGFLFGIPRSGATVREGGGAYRPNTNLEQLSDWLTKILVGVGLTQIQDLSESFVWLVERAGPAVADGDLGNVAAGAVMVLYTVCGFVAGYLLTRLYLTGAFQRADGAHHAIDADDEE